MPNELLTAQEVATIFRVDRRTVVRWAKTGKLDSIRTVGGHFRFTQHDVNKLLKNQ